MNPKHFLNSTTPSKMAGNYIFGRLNILSHKMKIVVVLFFFKFSPDLEISSRKWFFFYLNFFFGTPFKKKLNIFSEHTLVGCLRNQLMTCDAMVKELFNIDSPEPPERKSWDFWGVCGGGGTDMVWGGDIIFLRLKMISTLTWPKMMVSALNLATRPYGGRVSVRSPPKGGSNIPSAGIPIVWGLKSLFVEGIVQFWLPLGRKNSPLPEIA